MRKHPSTLKTQFYTLSLTLGALLVTACSTTTTPVNSVETFDRTIPTHWQASSESEGALDTQRLVNWWSQFKDPTLDALISKALQENTNIRTAFSRIQQARAERGLEKTNLLPSLNANLSGSETQSYHETTDSTTSSDAYSASLNLSWEIDLFGRLNKKLQAATAELEATTEDYHAVQVTLLSDVAEAYFNLRASEAKLDFTQKTLLSRQKTWQLIQWQETAGESDMLATQQALLSLQEAQALIPTLELAIQTSRNQLTLLCASFPSSLDSLLKKEAKLPEIPELIATGIPANTLRQRPDIRAAERRIEARTANLSAVERSRLPTLNLTGSMGVNASDLSDLFDLDRVVLGAIGRLSAPIWDAGKISRNIEIETERTRQTYIVYEYTVLNALSEVETAINTVKQTNLQLQIIEQSSQGAERLLVLAQMRYDAGDTDFLTVLNAQRTALSTAQNRINTQAENLKAHVQLYKSLGGGWNPARVPSK
jgi:NodT family efflux transporter outer membrane factor (OMF) lipoprotein